MTIRVRRIRKIRGLQEKNLTEALKVVREAEFTIDSSAGSLGRPDALKDEKTARSVVDRVLGRGSGMSHRHA
jgi:hypothetical protein